MAAISFLGFAVALAVACELWIRRSEFFTPIRMYLFFHGLTIGIAFLGFHEAMTGFSTTTSLVYFGSGISFVLGGLFYQLLAPYSNKNKSVVEEVKGQYNWNLHMGFALVMFVIFLLGFIWGVATYGGLPILTGKKSGTALDFYRSNPIAAILINFAGIVMILFYTAIFQNSHPKIKRWCVLGILITFGLYFMLMSRYLLVFFLFFALIYYSVGVKKVVFSRLVLWVSLLFFFIVGSFFLKFSSMYKNADKILKNEALWDVALEIPYKYIANNFWNLDYAISPENYESRHKPTYGFSVLSGLFDITYYMAKGIRNGMGYDSPFHESIQKVDGLNTVGYQWSLFKDFGFAGPLILPFVFGLGMSGLYRTLRERITIRSLGVYAFFGYAVCFSFFQAQWEMFIYMFGLIFFVIVSSLCQNKNFDIKPVIELK